MNIEQELFKFQDKKYAEFQAKLIPTIEAGGVIGVRVPAIRQLAKKLNGTEESKQFLNDLPHKYYDENMLHAALLTEMKNYDECIRAVENFLPYVDNWAVCDTMKPKSFKKNREKLLEKIKLWSKSKETYTCRFGLEMLMNFFLDADFKPEYLEIPAAVKSDEYYINMMIAWFFATALAKQWDATIPYIENRKLSNWTHNKTIQKARESYRITPAQKEYLKTLKY